VILKAREGEPAGGDSSGGASAESGTKA
jgi:hypothetical protein